ncbi:hypothetical protein ACQPUY_15530 [Clostridium nigeriense]|uniref:hypothetical protein n=1 Tax=Clostridium nigeriense TaxID=1805470 RepID=UPI003D345C75
MKKSNIIKSFIIDEIEENRFSETEINLFYACIEATECIYTASEIVANKNYNSYIEHIDSYIELADTLVYNAEKMKYEDYFIRELKYLLSNILVEKNIYNPTDKQELSVQIYLNSYGWIVNEEFSIAINLDINLIDSSKLRLTA